VTPFSPSLFEALPIIGIVRGFGRSQLEPIVRAAMRGGLGNIEITMNSAGATEQIKEAVQLAEGKINVGAGTVLSMKELELALSAGASFIVTPIVKREVIRAAVQAGIPVFPGAFTPTEIAEAWDLGAMMVKIFPAEILGPGFIKGIKGPFPKIKLLPTGGVDLESLEVFGKAGADGFGIGSPLFNRERILSEEWEWLEANCRAFSAAFQKSRAAIST
jgi:2-dehydro-3-deoxyphosphogluconate aldolase/(4S)-4-hydroxy-2-oxoglutarate aldolase